MTARRVVGLIVLLFVPFTVAPAAGLGLGPPPAGAVSALLLEIDAGRVLYAKNPEGEHAPASLVKLMTLYLALESVRAGEIRLSAVAVVSSAAAAADRYRMGLRAGEWVSFQTLLEGVAIASANDAAVAVAEALAGSVDAFVDRMNVKAKEMGLSHTRFANPHGLPGGEQYATASDLALLTWRLLADHREAGRFLEGQRFVHAGRVFERRFPLFHNPGGIMALKTGYTAEAGYNLAVVARKGGKQLLVVLLGAESRGSSFSEAARLLNFGFRNGEASRTLRSARQGPRLGASTPVRLSAPVQLAPRLR